MAGLGQYKDSRCTSLNPMHFIPLSKLCPAGTLHSRAFKTKKKCIGRLSDLGDTLYGKVTVIAEINRHHCHFRLHLYCGCQISVVTCFMLPQLRFFCKKLVAEDAKGVQLGGWAHISPLLHLSNPVTLTTNETLHTCILLYPLQQKWM